MSLRMPEPDAAVLQRRERIVAALRTIVPGEGVIAAERELRPYESDGLTAYRQHHHHGQLPVGGKPIAVIGPHLTFGCDHTLAGDDRP